MSQSDYYHKITTEAALKGEAFPSFVAFAGLAPSLNISPDGTFTGEMTGVGYGRQRVEMTDFVNGVMSNSAAMEWVVGTGWGAVQYVFIADAVQGGRILVYDDLGVTLGASEGDVLKIQIGAMTLP